MPFSNFRIIITILLHCDICHHLISVSYKGVSYKTILSVNICFVFFTIDEEQTDPKILRDYCRSSSSGRLKNDFMDMKKENQALKEKNGFAERDLVLLQEEYDSIKGKLEKCAMANEKLLESNNSLKVRKKIKIILMAARNCGQPY